MAWTLWRGDTLLGQVRMESLVSELTNSRPMRLLEYTSFLLPAPDAVLKGLSQVRVPVLDQDRFYQDPIEPAISCREEDAPPPPTPRPFAVLQPMDPEAAAGVTPAQQLRVLDDAGVQLHPRFIHLHEARYEPAIFALLQAGIPGEPVDPIPPEAYVNGSVWRFAATFDSLAT
jgi:hypothetical protein